MKLILAVDNDWGIGKDNQMLFHLKKDLAHFKETTMGNTLIMGRNTYESMGGALKGRKNIILTRSKDFRADDALVFHSKEEILTYLDDVKSDVFVIGGSQIADLFLDQIDEAIITKIDGKRDADTYLHNFDKDNNFYLSDEGAPIIDGEHSFQIVKYRRK